MGESFKATEYFSGKQKEFKDIGFAISYCPLHQAAPALLEAAKIAMLSVTELHGIFSPEAQNKLMEAITAAEAKAGEDAKWEGYQTDRP